MPTASRNVVFCHGFPHTGYVWHRQVEALTAAGYRAIAPDLRGYGRAPAPADPNAYTNAAVIEDLLEAVDTAVFVGLDFGAVLVWELALRAPERVEAVIVCNNPYLGRSPRRPSELFARWAQEHFLHLHHFQQPGVADAELAAAPREFLAKVYYALSGDANFFDTWRHPDGTRYLDALPEAPPLPWNWLSEAEFDLLATEFERTGFTGGLSWYRALDLNWELTEQFADSTVEVPAYFIYGEHDCDMAGFSGRDPIGRMRTLVPDLRAVEMVPGAGHLVQLEQTGTVNELLLRFLAELRLPTPPASPAAVPG